MKVTCNLVHLLWCLFFQLCHQLVFGLTVPRYKICRPLTRRTPVSLRCNSFPNAADDANTPSDPNPAILQETGGESTTSEITAPTSGTSSEIPEVTTRNKRPPLASKSSNVYANIYSGLYNLPLEMDEEEKFDEIENTSFYSNIRYSYGDDEEIDDVPEVKSSMVSKISDSSFGDDDLYSTAPKVPNERPPLISSIKREKTSDPTEDDEIITVNERPPLRRKTPLLVDGFAIQPSRAAAEKTKSTADLEGVYANIYSGLYNLPFIAEEEETDDDDDEVENTSFYSNIRYTTEEDDDDFIEAKSTIESKLEIIQPTASSSTANVNGPFTANERPPLVSAMVPSVSADAASSTAIPAANKDLKSSEERSGEGSAEGSSVESQEALKKRFESVISSIGEGRRESGQVLDRSSAGGNAEDEVAYPIPSLPCVSTATNSVHIVGERVRLRTLSLQTQNSTAVII